MPSRKYNIYGEDITEETRGSRSLDENGEVEEEVEHEIEPLEEVPEAFIPSFTVVPDSPEHKIEFPTEEQKKATIEGLYEKLGLKKAKDFLNQPVQDITPEKEKTLGRVTLMGARIFSSISMWCYSILGTEYGLVAPTVEHSYKMLHPIGRIIARHSKFVGNISPDVDDIIESLTAMSDYAVYAMAIMTEIREEKARNNGQSNGRFTANAYQARPSYTPDRSNGATGYPPSSVEPAQDDGFSDPINTGHLEGYQRYNYEMLRTLSARDYEARLRRSGKL